MTCVSNDYSYEEIFSRQLEALAKKGDLVVALTTSGRSKNIIRVLEHAKFLNVRSVLLTGKKGGLNHLVDESIVIPSSKTTHIQESHIMVGHIMCKIIEKELGYD